MIISLEVGIVPKLLFENLGDFECPILVSIFKLTMGLNMDFRDEGTEGRISHGIYILYITDY